MAGANIGLSRLSRGIGEEKKIKGQRKLDVSLEPEDYYNIQPKKFFLPPIHQPAWQNSNIMNREMMTHKTFSTRKGALLLYSEDLVSVGVGSNGAKKKALEAEDSNLFTSTNDFCSAILSYGAKGNESSPIFLNFVKGRNKLEGSRSVRPGFSAKRYMANWSRSWDDSVLNKLRSNGNIWDKNLFQPNAANPSIYRRINDDLSQYPSPYHVTRSMLLSPGDLQQYEFYRIKSTEAGKQSTQLCETTAKIPDTIAVVTRDKDNKPHLVSYKDLDNKDQTEVLQRLLIQSVLSRCQSIENLVKEGMSTISTKSESGSVIESPLVLDIEQAIVDLVTSNSNQIQNENLMFMDTSNIKGSPTIKNELETLAMPSGRGQYIPLPPISGPISTIRPLKKKPLGGRVVKFPALSTSESLGSGSQYTGESSELWQRNIQEKTANNSKGSHVNSKSNSLNKVSTQDIDVTLKASKNIHGSLENLTQASSENGIKGGYIPKWQEKSMRSYKSSVQSSSGSVVLGPDGDLLAIGESCVQSLASASEYGNEDFIDDDGINAKNNGSPASIPLLGVKINNENEHETEQVPSGSSLNYYVDSVDQIDKNKTPSEGHSIMADYAVILNGEPTHHQDHTKGRNDSVWIDEEQTQKETFTVIDNMKEDPKNVISTGDGFLDVLINIPIEWKKVESERPVNDTAETDHESEVKKLDPDQVLHEEKHELDVEDSNPSSDTHPDDVDQECLLCDHKDNSVDVSSPQSVMEEIVELAQRVVIQKPNYDHKDNSVDVSSPQSVIEEIVEHTQRVVIQKPNCDHKDNSVDVSSPQFVMEEIVEHTQRVAIQKPNCDHKDNSVDVSSPQSVMEEIVEHAQRVGIQKPNCDHKDNSVDISSPQSVMEEIVEHALKVAEFVIQRPKSGRDLAADAKAAASMWEEQLKDMFHDNHQKLNRSTSVHCVSHDLPGVDSWATQSSNVNNENKLKLRIHSADAAVNCIKNIRNKKEVADTSENTQTKSVFIKEMKNHKPLTTDAHSSEDETTRGRGGRGGRVTCRNGITSDSTDDTMSFKKSDGNSEQTKKKDYIEHYVDGSGDAPSLKSFNSSEKGTSLEFDVTSYLVNKKEMNSLVVKDEPNAVKEDDDNDDTKEFREAVYEIGNETELLENETRIKKQKKSKKQTMGTPDSNKSVKDVQNVDERERFVIGKPKPPKKPDIPVPKKSQTKKVAKKGKKKVEKKAKKKSTSENATTEKQKKLENVSDEPEKTQNTLSPKNDITANESHTPDTVDQSISVTSSVTPESPQFIIIRDEFSDSESDEPIQTTADLKSSTTAEDYFSDVMSSVTEDSTIQGPDSVRSIHSISRSQAKRAKRAAEAERRKQEVEQKRKKREEAKRKSQEELERREQLRREFEEDRQRKEEEIRLRRERETEERQRHEAALLAKKRQAELALEREKKQKEERQRKMEEMARKKKAEEQKRKEEEERRRREEDDRRKAEQEMLEAMAEEERYEYEKRKQEEERLQREYELKERLIREEEARKAQEEAEKLMLLKLKEQKELELRLQFNRLLQSESNILTHSQEMTRAFTFSYYDLLEALGMEAPDWLRNELEQYTEDTP